MRFPGSVSLAVAVVLLSGSLRAEVPRLFSHQGRLTIAGSLAQGAGWFKFAFVAGQGGAAEILWSNSPDANGDGQPDAPVTLTLTRGLYSVLLGDPSLASMAILPAEVFDRTEVYLRIWFDSDGVGEFERLEPDQRVASVGYSMRAASVPDGAITAAKLAPDALGSVPAELISLKERIAALEAQTTTLAARLQALDAIDLMAVSPQPDDSLLAAAGFTPFYNIPAPGWVAGSTVNAPSARYGHSAVWTGTEWILWGGSVSSSLTVNSGAAYDPHADAWRTVSTVDSPAPRTGHSAVWTGAEMIVWGGYDQGQFLGSGGRYRPASQSWRALASALAPSGRDGHVAVWTGSRMIIWGGRNSDGLLADGAVYDPVANAWSPLSLPNAPAARRGATAVWATTGSILIWGGEGTGGFLQSGAELLLNPDGTPAAWRELPVDQAPSARIGHSAVWTGLAMIVWGGRGDGGYCGDGAAYDPLTDAWTPLPTADAPTGRADHSGVWTGTEMLVVGGRSTAGALSSGAAYNPLTQDWRLLSADGDPQAHSGASAVWTGWEIMVFGGQNGGTPVGALQRLSPQPSWYVYRKL